ncbi:MAG: hypothetical protein KatS3mg027_0644 [Bacteroidia bacterium]|nr:MAG: hypothetical protein KatS3mg027_0644 [Bacteroidia bacterium]
MQLQSDIKIEEYNVVPQKISEKELKQKSLLLSLSIFQDELESAIIDLEAHSVYTSSIYASSQRKFSNNELTFLLNDFIHRYHLQSLSFKSIQIIHSSPHFTLCPAEFYLPEHKRDLLQFVHPLSSDEIILTNDFESIKILYAIPQSLHNNLLQIFPSARFFHSSTSMLYILFFHPLLQHSKLWIHLHPNYIEVIAKDQKQFLFYNTFDTKTSLDVLYYILFVIEQLKFSPKETVVYISGNISLKHSIIQLLQKYLHSVQILNHHPKLHILPLNSSLLTHHHFITLNHHLCASYQENTKAES